jgi:hypothetical protein
MAFPIPMIENSITIVRFDSAYLDIPFDKNTKYISDP